MSEKKNRISIRKTAGTALLVACLATLQVPLAIGATSVESVEGSGYGVYASVKIGFIEKAIGPTPGVTIPTNGGSDSATKASASLSIGLTEILGVGLIEVSSMASGVGGPDGQVESLASVANVDLIGGVISADKVVAECSADGSGANGGVTLASASISGIGALSVSPAPNTGISIPGVGSLTLNKQTKNSDGTLTVTALSLSLLPILGTGTVNVGRVVCGTDSVAAPTTTTTVAPTSTTQPESSSTTQAPTTTTTPRTTTTNGATPTTEPGVTTTTQDPTTTTTIESASSTTTPPTDESDENWCDDLSSETAQVLPLSLSMPNDPPSSGMSSNGNVPWWWILIFAVIGLGVGHYIPRFDWTSLADRFASLKARVR